MSQKEQKSDLQSLVKDYFNQKILHKNEENWEEYFLNQNKEDIKVAIVQQKENDDIFEDENNINNEDIEVSDCNGIQYKIYLQNEQNGKKVLQQKTLVIHPLSLYYDLVEESHKISLILEGKITLKEDEEEYLSLVLYIENNPQFKNLENQQFKDQLVRIKKQQIRDTPQKYGVSQKNQEQQSNQKRKIDFSMVEINEVQQETSKTVMDFEDLNYQMMATIKKSTEKTGFGLQFGGKQSQNQENQQFQNQNLNLNQGQNRKGSFQLKNFIKSPFKQGENNQQEGKKSLYKENFQIEGKVTPLPKKSEDKNQNMKNQGLNLVQQQQIQANQDQFQNDYFKKNSGGGNDYYEHLLVSQAAAIFKARNKQKFVQKNYEQNKENKENLNENNNNKKGKKTQKKQKNVKKSILKEPQVQKKVKIEEGLKTPLKNKKNQFINQNQNQEGFDLEILAENSQEEQEQNQQQLQLINEEEEMEKKLKQEKIQKKLQRLSQHISKSEYLIYIMGKFPYNTSNDYDKKISNKIKKAFFPDSEKKNGLKKSYPKNVVKTLQQLYQ
ncbi:hypothetical protein PPERSA_03865 [Pseudocohnilembus persalinus]|uniref:Uncharacterized protein n=1 Tax=Pseudocohnilembus persalinus TaxID=266149 RepID=A0A0V0Q986_PSEPJ|nr:hypothetical protein PPERSA_03865 [Pseudocohnilembus persalinus]|eukprot:KRW98730.1 hypothetical protein PPERSA_03865 [Pseudocohnilembus persalinus]